jgi:hypothetical protein
MPNLFLRPIEPSVERSRNHVNQGMPTRTQAGLGLRGSGEAGR